MSSMLSFRKIVRCDENVRSKKDRRRKVDYYVVSYVDEDGQEYRKSFEVAVGESFTPFQFVPVKSVTGY